MALGGVLILLILLVLGVKGCLDARADRALSDYANNVTQIVEETAQTSENFFKKLEEPGQLSTTDFVEQVNADRSAVDSYASRIDDLDAPGDMSEAQRNLELSYELRSSAMNVIANRMPTALGDAGAAKATAAISRQMRKLLASDVVYEELARPQINEVLANNGISGEDVPASSFLASDKWLQENAVASALGTSGGEEAATPGVHGTELGAVIVNGTELAEGAPAVIATEGAVELEAQVINQGESAESGVTVVVSYSGNTVQGDISELALGEVGTAAMSLTPVPKGETTLEVKVEPVPGEKVTENNEATFTVTFE